MWCVGVVYVPASECVWTLWSWHPIRESDSPHMSNLVGFFSPSVQP